MIYKISALSLLAVFYGCYILKMIKQRRQGIQTDQIGKGKTGFVKAVETLMKIATYLVIPVEVLSIFLLENTPPLPVRIAGVVIGLMGDIVFVMSVLTMKDSWRAGVPEDDKTELVTDGIYRISRNPAFLGFDLLYIGILCAFFNWYLFAASAFAVIMLHLQIVNVEEDYLIVTFGEEYLEYKKHVNRYLGRR